MRIRRLSLTNFRNFIRLETEIPGGAVLLLGRNAQGKTSLLEAISYLAAGRSSHAASDRELVNFLSMEDPAPFSRMVAEIEGPDRLSRLEIRIRIENGGGSGGRVSKEILINGVKRNLSDLGTVFNAVTFLPQDLLIIAGPPRNRRRLLDDLISQASAAYTQALTDYGKALSQRNALLKRLHDRQGEPASLGIWTEKLAELGAQLMRDRALSIRELDSLARPIHRQLTDQAELLRLEYLPSYEPGAAAGDQLPLHLEERPDYTSISRQSLRAGLLDTWNATLEDDLERGVTRIGPHRDELAFLSNGLDLRLYGSRGQIRTAMLAERLAEIEWIERQTGTSPVLLLDEVLAELDQQRRQDLLARVLKADQAILTTTDRDLFDARFLEAAEIWEVEGGKLRRLKDAG